MLAPDDHNSLDPRPSGSADSRRTGTAHEPERTEDAEVHASRGDPGPVEPTYSNRLGPPTPTVAALLTLRRHSETTPLHDRHRHNTTGRAADRPPTDRRQSWTRRFPLSTPRSCSAPTTGSCEGCWQSRCSPSSG